MSAFVSMGGYGLYVWPAVGVFFVVLLVDFLVPGIRQRRILRDVRTKARRQQNKRGP